jgi:hypothetical protein
MTQKANEPSDSQRECDKAKQVQIARYVTFSSFFLTIKSRIKLVY